MPNEVLYLSYTGMTDTLGESQVLTYMLGLSKLGYHIHVVSAEKKDLYHLHKDRIKDKIKGTNIDWHPVDYHKHPPIISTLIDYKNLFIEAKRIIEKYSIRIIHCRGYIPALVGQKLHSRFKQPFIFDMRGFWPDEKLESGVWRSSVYKPIYSFFKKKEQNLFRQANKIVSLTFNGRDEILKRHKIPASRIGVIPTCVDFDIFPAFDLSIREKIRANLNIPLDSKVLIYSGSLGGNYNIDIPFKIFRTFKKIFPKSHFLILSRSNPEMVQAYIDNQKLDPESIIITSVPFPDVHKYLMAADVGLIFYGKGFSNIGRSPTKLGEYWASGIPAISISKIGDVERIISKYPNSGLVLSSLGKEYLIKTMEKITFKSSKNQLRTFAKDYYSLDRGVHFYKNIYEELV